MNTDYIIVQAGGKGTRLEHLTRNKPKALVPIGNRPMIFHLFEKYPEKKYIVIGDYKCDVLSRYLEAFAKVDYTVVNANGKKGTCGGMREALSLIPEDERFLLIWCDLVLPESFELPEDECNYVGISKDFRCRWSYNDNRFYEEPSEEHGVAGLFVFNNKQQLRAVPEEGEFVRWLSATDIAFKELPLYRTKEYGVLQEYAKLTGGRCRPFNRITVEGDVLIKEGIDEQGRKLAVRERAWYNAVIEKEFTNIPKVYSTEPLKMERIDGKNVYEYASLTREEKANVISELVMCLRQVHELGTVSSDKASFDDAYIGKTFDRLKKVKDLVPFAKHPYVFINGRRCRNVFFHQDELEERISSYFPEEFKFIHGDCTFSNMLLRGGKSPVLIDPRGYFGLTELYGDVAYDWAKLYYSVVGNYDQFNLRRFDLSIGDDSVEIKIESNGWEDMEEFYLDLVKDEISSEQIKLIHAIIWLSLTTYAWEDYDSICGAFYNGLYYLEEVL